MDRFSTHSSAGRTLNTSHETVPVPIPRLDCAPLSKTRSEANSSRRQNSFQIKRTYDPYINEDRFREKRVMPTQRRAAKKLKSALTIQRVYRGYRVRKWFDEHKGTMEVVNRVLRGGESACRVRMQQCK